MLHLALLAAIAAQAPAVASPSADAERLFVFAFKNDNVDARIVAALERDVAEEAGAYGYDAVSSQDLASMLDVEAARQAAGCIGEASCLSEIAGGLGAAFVITGTVAKLDATQTEVALVLLDRTGSSVLGRSSASGGDLDTLRSNTRRAARQLWGVTDGAPEAKGGGGSTGGLGLGLMVGGGIAAALGLVGAVGFLPLANALSAESNVNTAAAAYEKSGRRSDLQTTFDEAATRDAAAADWNTWGLAAVVTGGILVVGGLVAVGVGATLPSE